MNKVEKEFYKDLYLCLQDEDWSYTGAESTIGNVWWRLKLPDTQYEDISAETEIGLTRSPTYATFFVQVKSKEYPQQIYTKNLESEPEKTKSGSVIAEAKDFALSLLAEKSSEIREKIRVWEEELATARAEAGAK